MRGASQVDVFRDLALDILLFPVWWYTHGLLRMVKWVRESIRGYARLLALEIWIKNLFVPMFGQYDWQSRLISIFMRSVQIVGRGFVLIIIVGVLCAIFSAYVVALPVFGLITLYHLLGSLLYV